MDVNTYQAEATLAQTLMAAIPTLRRQDITVQACDESHTECAQTIAVLLSPDEANQLIALVRQAGLIGVTGTGPGESLTDPKCLVCGCLLSNLRCGHTCCCSGGRR